MTKRFVVAAVLGLVACGEGGPPAAQYPTAPPAPQPYPSPPAQAWPWMTDPVAAAQQLGFLSKIDPSVLSKLPGGCQPIRIGNIEWMSPCEGLRVFHDMIAGLPQRAPMPEGGPLAASVDLRAAGLTGPVRDQDQVGVCAYFAVTSLMENGLRRAGRSENLSVLHILATDTFRSAQHSGMSAPVTVEHVWPYHPSKACKIHAGDDYCAQHYGVAPGSWQSDPVLVTERANADRWGFASAFGFEKVSIDPNEIARVLASGQVVYGGFDIDRATWSAAKDLIADYPTADSRGDNGGGHGVIFVGYSTGPTRAFLIQNSWGTAWGNGGYAWIAEPTLRRWLTEAMTLRVGDRTGREFPRTR